MCYDAISYERLILKHVMRCSASSAPSTTGPHCDDITSNAKPEAKVHTNDNDAKPAAVVSVPIAQLPVGSSHTVKSHGIHPTRVNENVLNKNSLNMKAAATTTKDIILSGVAFIDKSYAELKRDSDKKPVSVKKSSSQHSDKSSTASTTKASSTISITSSHLLAQTWWREKTVRRNPGLSVPFCLESCLAVSNVDEEKTGDDATTTARGGMQLRTSSRRKNETLNVTCPICRKPFSAFTAVSWDYLRETSFATLDILLFLISFAIHVHYLSDIDRGCNEPSR